MPRPYGSHQHGLKPRRRPPSHLLARRLLPGLAVPALQRAHADVDLPRHFLYPKRLFHLCPDAGLDLLLLLDGLDDQHGINHGTRFGLQAADKE